MFVKQKIPCNAGYNQLVINNSSELFKKVINNWLYVSMGVLICLDMVSIETLDLDVVKE